MKRGVAIGAIVLSAVLTASPSAAISADAAIMAERVVDLPLASGKHQRILYVAPSTPRATVVMFPGGTGNVGIEPDGTIRHDDNFVVRTRSVWVDRGYAVLIPDWISHASLRGVRSSQEYAGIIADLVRYAHEQSPSPIFLLGTSQGAIAAANGASHASPASVAGVILTESVSVHGGSGETVFDANLQAISIPALIVANRDDRCNVAPPEQAPKIAAALAHSPDVRIIEVSGGVDRSRRACGSLTPHGYYGIEDKVVAVISSWIDSHIHNASDR